MLHTRVPIDMENQNTIFSEYIEPNIQIKKDLLQDNISEIIHVADVFLNAYRIGNTIFWFGNEGSAAKSQHLAYKSVSRFFIEKKPLASIASTTNSSELTAIAIDYEFNAPFLNKLRYW